MRDILITEAVVEHVQERLSRDPLVDRLRALMQAEPNLHHAVNYFAVGVLDELEGLPHGAQDRAYDAVWRAVLLALGCYHHAYADLCRDPELEKLLRQFDPTLVGDPGSAYPSEGARPGVGPATIERDEWINGSDGIVDPRPPRNAPGTPEMLVTAADLQRAAAAVSRHGRAATLEYWLAREPVLTRHLVDGCRDIYRQLLHQCGRGPAHDAALLQEADGVILAGLSAWAGGQFRLWAGTLMGDRLACFDPQLTDDPPAEGPR